MKIIAIVAAAGSGKRFGAAENKVFVELGERPILSYSLLTLQYLPIIDEIITVTRNEDVERCRQIIDRYGIIKARHIAIGGDERQDSIFNALSIIDDPDTLVAIHDGARPLASAGLFKRCIDALRDCDGVIPAVPLTDTIKQHRDGFIEKTLDRDGLCAVQTPQVFSRKRLRDAYIQAKSDGLRVTDDASVIEHYGGLVRLIEGERGNIKITRREDIEYALFFLGDSRFFHIPPNIIRQADDNETEQTAYAD